MTKQEYRNHIHAITDLIMDIQETDSEDKPAISVNIYSDVSGVIVWNYEGKSAKQYTIHHQKRPWDTSIEKVLEMLQKIKAELDKKEKFRQRPN